MRWIAKLVTAAQALLLAQAGAAKASDAASPPDFTEAAAWQTAVSAGTPDSLQGYISRFPQGARLGEAFELIVLGEIAAARSASQAAVTGVQLSEARRDGLEVLEHDFDPSTNKSGDGLNQGGGGLTPY